MKEFDKLQEACEHFRGPHFDEIKCILLQWCKLVDMPRYEFEQKDIPDVVTLEKLSEMPYQYADEAEREYYTKWKKDLIEKSEKIGEKNACIKVAKKLLALGMDIDKISIIT